MTTTKKKLVYLRVKLIKYKRSISLPDQIYKLDKICLLIFFYLKLSNSVKKSI